MTNAEKQRKYCIRCRDNFYNGNNPYGIEECWSLKSAEVVWKKRVRVDQCPPWNQKATRVLSCQREKGYVFVGPKQVQ